MKAMFDINVVLDIVGNREPFREASEAAYFSALEHGEKPCLSAHAYPTLYYLLGAAATRRQRSAAMDWIFDSFSPASVTAVELTAARGYRMPDFEDAIVAAAANSSACDLIVTRNANHFAGGPVKAVSPSEFTRLFKSTHSTK